MPTDEVAAVVLPQLKRDFYRLLCKEELESKCPKNPVVNLLLSRKLLSFAVTS